MKTAVYIIAAALVVIAGCLAAPYAMTAADAAHTSDAERRATFAAVAEAL